MNLTSHEIKQLIEALLVWEKEPNSKGLQDVMFSSLLSGFGPEESRDERMAKSKRESDATMSKAQMEMQLRREASVLLQAKLISMRQEAIQSEIA